MSLCGNMVSDFTDGTGEQEPRTGAILYDGYDLEHGVRYAADLLEAGHEVDPVDGFDLASFERWCRSRL